MKKRLYALLLSFLVVFVMIPSETTLAESSIVIESIDIKDTGECEVLGYLSDNTAGEQVTILVLTKEYKKGDTLSTVNTIYIDQTETGNNGVFLFEFRINERFNKRDAVFMFGSSTGASTVKIEATIPSISVTFDRISNNSVLYGNDVYQIGSNYLTSEYVVKSIVDGGNIIYFKLGDKWYNLLDKRATSSDFLIEKNATSGAEVKTVATGVYYMKTDKANLIGAA